MRRTQIGILALLLLASLAVYAAPARNVNPHRHPNLAAAQRLAHQAFEKVNAAQKANEWDMGGHAAKAKELLDQVNNELKQAAEAANEH
jgi:membrane protein required for beta-lactamase induction